MFDARIIANAFIDIAKKRNRALTNMQIQKLVYFAHGWHLALTERPLISDDVKAWTFGPVIPNVYEALRPHKASPITEPIQVNDSDARPADGSAVEMLLHRIFEKYGNLGGLQMSYLTHVPGTPWYETWKQNRFGVIPNELIKRHFQELRTSAK